MQWQCICLHKEIALQTALIAQMQLFAVLSPAKLSEFEGQNSLTVDYYKIIFRQG